MEDLEQVSNSLHSLINQKQYKKRVITPQLSTDDFTLLKVIGKGSYGKVLLVQKKDTNQYLAMKMLKKEHIIKKRQVEHLKTQRFVLGNITHPFIVKMKYAFQNQQKLYFLLEYCPGGQLFYHLSNVDKFQEPLAQFYAAQILLAIEHLHLRDIIYRDLKPQNVLIAADGYIKLTDFGLSKQNIKGLKDAKSICGTPEYLAPQMLSKQGYGKAVDWWMFGSILYQMLTGLPPFFKNSQSKADMFYAIKNLDPKWEKYLSPQSVALLSGLLAKKPEQRLGAKKLGILQIKQHPWFKGINWDLLIQKKIKPIFKPRIKTASDTSNIDQQDQVFIRQKPQDSYDDKSALKQQLHIPGKKQLLIYKVDNIADVITSRFYIQQGVIRFIAWRNFLTTG